MHDRHIARIKLQCFDENQKKEVVSSLWAAGDSFLLKAGTDWAPDLLLTRRPLSPFLATKCAMQIVACNHGISAYYFSRRLLSTPYAKERNQISGTNKFERESNTLSNP